MAFADLFKKYPNKNKELRSIAKTCYEFGKTIAKEPSAGHTHGLDTHALRRQRQYVEHAKAMVAAMAAKPIPDLPASHPTTFPVDLTAIYKQFVGTMDGEQLPINEATQLLAESWMTVAVEMAKSNSAGLAGSLVDFDAIRATNNIDAIDKLLDEIEERPMLDLPETSVPEAIEAVSGMTEAS